MLRHPGCWYGVTPEEAGKVLLRTAATAAGDWRTRNPKYEVMGEGGQGTRRFREPRSECHAIQRNRAGESASQRSDYYTISEPEVSVDRAQALEGDD